MTAVEEAPAAVEAAEPTFEALARRVDEARSALDDLAPDDAATAIDLQAAIEAFHRPALVAIVQTLRDDPRGKELLFELVDDPSVRAVLALHGIIRADPITRANQALATVRPYRQSHGGDVEIVRIEGGTAYVRMQGSCNGCSMTAVTLQEGVTEALVAGVDEVDRVEVLDDEPTSAFIPVGSVGRKGGVDSGWLRGPAVEDLVEGQIHRVDLERTDGTPESFVVTNVDQTLAVFRNACVHQGLSLDGGLIDDGVLVCPWHGFRFDATSGECVSAPGAQLEPLPSRVDEGHLWIRPGGG